MFSIWKCSISTFIRLNHL